MTALLLNFLYLNVSLKHVMVDSVLKEKRKALALRVFIQMFTISVNYTSLKYFTLTTVALFNNLGPLVTVILGCLFFGESITRGQMLMMIVAFGAIQCMIFGGAPEESTQ